jgi:hypothetical protein
MLNPNEKQSVAKSLGLLFSAFPASRAIDPEATVFYVEDVSVFSLIAIDRAISRFRRGQVADRNNAFAPSVAEFVAEVAKRQEAYDVETFWDKTAFVEFDTPEWRALCKQRGGSMPAVERNGKSGWYVPKDELARLPAHLIEAETVLLANPVRFMPPKLGQNLPAYHVPVPAFTAGDDNGEEG